MREINSSDIKTITEIYNNSFSKPWQEDDFIKLLNNPSAKGFIIENYAFVIIQAIDDEAEIITIAVTKKNRNQGLGKKLLQKIKEDFSKVFLEVNETNVPALNLYSSVGFKKSGIRKKYYNKTDDAIMMTFQK